MSGSNRTSRQSSASSDILADLARISDVIEESALYSESERTLADSVVNAITDAGLFKMKLPVVLGGLEANPVEQFEAIEAMTMLDTSAGWNFMIGAASVGIPGAFLGDKAIKQIFADGKVPRFASVGLPGGQAVPEANGFRLTGRWPFASGVRHSEWIWCGALLPGEGKPGFRMLTLPLSDADVVDDWHVAGLKGTGSCDVVVNDLFVPADFTWDPFADQPKRGGPMFRIGLPGILTNEHAAFASGAARRVIDEVSKLSHSKKRGLPPAPLSDRGSFQSVLGRSILQLEAARELALTAHAAAYKTVEAGDQLGPGDQAKLRASATYITEVALEVTSRMFRYSGASALHSTGVIQRYHRDLTAAAQHFMVSDSAYEVFGRASLGYEDINPMG